MNFGLSDNLFVFVCFLSLEIDVSEASKVDPELEQVFIKQGK